MKKADKKPIIGIIGAVGAGKTTVAREFARRNCGIIDADKLNHEVLGRPDIVAQLVDWWGVSIIGANGETDRNAVGEIVFNDKDELKKLTDLVYPLIERRQNELIEAFQADSKIKAIVLDIPLLLEVGLEKMCDYVVFVHVKRSIRVKRLKKNRGWSEEKIKKVEKLQLTLDNKVKMSENTIDNNSGIPATASQVDRILALILGVCE